MKYILSKMIAFTCVICMVLSCGVIVRAADAPTISVTTDTAKKHAQINLKDVGIMIYSAQITFKMDSSAEYTLSPNDSKAYSVVKTDESDNTVTIYIDSTNLMDGSEEIDFTFISSDKEMHVPDKAELTLVDRSMRSVTYEDAAVELSESDTVTPKPTKRPSTGGGGGGGGGGSSVRSTAAPATSPSATEVPSATEEPSATAVPDENDVTDTKQPLFDDVESDYWAADVIAYVTETGLFQGTSETTFEPKASMTRAMYVTVLKRFGEKIDPAFEIPCDTPMAFDDVDENAWYYDAASWAGGTGLVNGIGDNKFGPSDPVTREQIAVMTINFANLCGVDLSELTDVEAQVFPDDADISDWAVDAVYTAQQIGLVSGRETGLFAPKESATRAEVAAILQRFAEKLTA